MLRYMYMIWISLLSNSNQFVQVYIDRWIGCWFLGCYVFDLISVEIWILRIFWLGCQYMLNAFALDLHFMCEL